jgi:putative FmdB family regulatory protein
MPIYVYEGTKGHHREIWQGINDEPLTECPICKVPIHRIITVPGGHVMEPNGIYQPLPGIDPKTKRGREHKVTKREYEKNDRALRDEMLALGARGPKLELEPRKTSRWI